MGKVVSLNISPKRGTFKEPVDFIELKVQHGIVGDAHAGDWHRQVSLLDLSSFAKMTSKVPVELRPGIFAENITTEGVELFTLPIGTQLEIGETLVEVTQIGKECHHHCQIYQQVGKCVMPLEGIFVKVLKGGVVKPGDEINVVNPIRVAILTLSDKGFKGEREDLSGPALAQALQDKAAIVAQ